MLAHHCPDSVATDQQTDQHVVPHRSGFTVETEREGRQDHPNPKDKIDPLFPGARHRKRRDCEGSHGNAQDICVPRGYAGVRAVLQDERGEE